jgi:hypothetical protein
MATRGRTEMERLVLEQELLDPSEATKELRDLKVRYGELVTHNNKERMRTYGFGTLRETATLRRKHASLSSG